MVYDCFHKCKNSWIKSEKMYGHVCGILAADNKDCTIIDVGCGNLPNLYEIKTTSIET